MIDHVFKQQKPLDIRRLQHIKTHYYIPITDARLHAVRYISNADTVDVFETLRATTAVPILFDKEVVIEGTKYTDGAMLAPFEKTIRKAKDLGATLVIAIDSRSRRRLLAPVFDEDPNIVLISNEKLPAGWITKNRTQLEETFALGYHDVHKNQKLRSLLEG